MNYHISPSAGVPAYMQLYHLLRADIVSGAYPPGARLPSKRLLSEECGVSVITVEHAYAILLDEGYVRAKEKSGYFVEYRETDAPVPILPEPAQARANIHHAQCGFPFSVLSKTMRRVLQECGEKILVKSPNHGLYELRASIRNYLARSTGISVRPEQIIIGSGAEYLYGLIVQLIGNGRIFAVESPCYEKIRRVYRALNVKCEALKLGKDGIKSSELEKSMATVLHITPFNSFPSGATASASKRAEYVRWAKARGGFLIEDNYDSELTVSTKSEDTLFSLSPENHVIYVNTFSRTIAPSIRAGYMVLPEALLPEFEERLGFYSCTVPVFEQYVLSFLIESGDFERHINRVRRARRKQLKHPEN